MIFYICPVTGETCGPYPSVEAAVTSSQVYDEMMWGGHGYASVTPDSITYSKE